MIPNLIKKRRQELNLTLEDIGKAVGVGKSTVKKWEDGSISNMKKDKILLLAKILNVNPLSLLNDSGSDNYAINQFDAPPSTYKVPRLGRISCGAPIMSEQNYDGLDSVPDCINCDFTLLCEGDSMIGARINDGDLVYIKQQSTVENGQIAAILVDGSEKLLKRVYLTSDTITLQAENPAYPPRVFVGEDMNRVSIIGRAVAFTALLK